MNPSPLSTANGSPSQSTTERPRLVWGAPTAAERGPVIATLRNPNHRNAVGSHAGGYSVYRALAIAARTLAHDHIADLTDTAPVERIGPHPQWGDGKKIVSLDPWGHLVGEVFRDHLARGYDVRPTIAVTRAHIDMPEIRAAIAARRVRADGDIVSAHGSVRVMKAAIDPVWHLPGIAERFGLDETESASVFRNLIEGGNLTQYGLHAAVTRAAQDADTYDRATELEYMGGRIVELPANDWTRIAEAA